MKINNAILLLLCFITMIISCRKDETSISPTTSYGSVYGKVYKSGTTLPVISASVTVGNYASTTDTSGNYEIKDIPIGSYTLKVTRTDFLDYMATVQINTGSKNMDVSLTSTIIQKITGKVMNRLNTAIVGAKISCAGKNTITDAAGQFEISDINAGNQSIKVTATYYNDLNQAFLMPSGTKNLNLQLTSSTISSSVSKLRYIDGNYSLTIQWDSLNIPTLLGYNIYYRKTYFWTQSDYDYIYNPGWAKINSSLLTQNQYYHTTEEYNVFYDYYVLPVNIDGIESTFLSGTTNVLEVPGNKNNQTLFSLSFGSTTPIGPYTIPSVNAYIVLFVDWRYDLNNYPFANWDLFLSTNNSTWTLIHSFTTGDIFGGRRIWYLDLEAYKGQSIYLKYSGTMAGYFNILKILQFNK